MLNKILQLHPLHRFLLSLFIGLVCGFVAWRFEEVPVLLKIVLGWIGFALTLLLLDWIIIVKRKLEEIKKKAKQDDGSIVFVFFIILFAAFASMTVVLLLTTGDSGAKDNPIYIPATIVSIILSWFIIHTQYIFHYAHEYWDDDDKNDSSPGLKFPEDDEPDYLDFAYFSLCLGSTFQVSDVEITSKKIRRIAMAHGILSFFLNTFVVALTINIVAGMSES